MAYTITLSNGNNLVTIPDGTVDTSYSSLALFGKNFAGYGPLLNENLVRELENFASPQPPANPLQGQLWWDSSNKRLNIRDTSAWKIVSGPTSAATTPNSTVVGDVWWDTENSQLKVYSGTSWDLIGPAYTKNQQLSGQFVTNVIGSDNQPRLAVLNYVGGTLMSVLSKSPTFQVTSLPGFTMISPGLNLSDSSVLRGDVSNANSLGGVLAANYLRGDVSSVSTQGMSITNNNGLTIGANNNISINYNSLNNENRIDGLIAGQSIAFRVNKTGVMYQALKIDGVTGLATVAAYPSTDLGIATKGSVEAAINANNGTSATVMASKSYVDTAVSNGITTFASSTFNGLSTNGPIVPTMDDSIDIGTPSLRFRTVHSTRTVTMYADLAENYVADAQYEPGTVLAFGGEQEVTLCSQISQTRVAGVVSTNPAHLMNGMCEGEFVVAIALQGRCPLKVSGNVRKGDLLVAGDNGAAIVNNNATAGRILGKSLVDADGAEHIIEAAIGRA